MAITEPSFTIGIEEEYLLVDRETRDLADDPPKSMIDECAALCGGQVSPEFLRSQIEVGTRVCSSVAEARDDLASLRRAVVEVADRHGLAPIASSTHPFAHWLTQKPTEKDRYIALAREMQATARRLLICGMHVHVGIDDDDLRIDLMNQLAYFLPHLLALSCSSPFWEGSDTGLKSFRLTIFNALPRSGMPENFASYGEYQRHVGVLINAGILEDTTKIWWDLRPSGRYPTLETRIMDVCTRIDDVATLTALAASLLRRLYRLRRDNQRWRVYSHLLLNENRWRAMRYSFDDGLIDLAKGQVVPFDELLEEIIELIEEDAEALGCKEALLASREILRRGTSAHTQVAVYNEAKAKGADHQEALNAVVDWLIEETSAGLAE